MYRPDPADPRPVLLVDVDGVLNPWAAPDSPDGYREYGFFPGERVLLAPAHGDLLRSLAVYFELVWATAWEHRANELIGPVLALPELPVIEFPAAGTDPVFAKLPAISAAVGMSRPCAWIDDVHPPEHYRWAGRRNAPTLIVYVDPATGLTARIVRQLTEWAVSLDRPPTVAGEGGSS